MGKLSIYRLNKDKYNELSQQGKINDDGFYIIKDKEESFFGEINTGQKVDVDVSGKTVTINGHNVDLNDYTTVTEINELLNGKVDKQTGKGLSTNDFDNEYMDKLDALQILSAGDNISISTGGTVSVVYVVKSSEKGAADGVATLDSNGKVPMSQINDSILGNVQYQGLWDASTGTAPSSKPSKGQYWITSDSGVFSSTYFEVGDWIICDAVTPSIVWHKVDNTDAVASVNGKTGVVVITKDDLSLGNVDNTSDLSKPISTATQAALDLKADKTELDEKADIDGIYPNLVAGNLSGEDTDAVVDYHSSFLYRSTAGSASVNDGQAKVTELRGNVVGGVPFTADYLEAVFYNMTDYETETLSGCTLNSDGTITTGVAGHNIVYAHVLKGAQGSGSNNGYRVVAKTDMPMTLTRVGYMASVPTTSSTATILSAVNLGGSDNRNVYLPSADGYLLADVNDAEAALIHIAWSYDPTSKDEDYSVSRLNLREVIDLIHPDSHGLYLAGDAYDYIDGQKSKVYKTVERKDMGTLAWTEESITTDSATTYFYKTNSVTDIKTGTANVSANLSYNVSVNTSGTVYVSTGETRITDPATEWNGVYLYYELATVTAVSMTSSMSYMVGDFGTEEFLNTTVAPSAVTIHYYPNYKDNLRNLQSAINGVNEIKVEMEEEIEDAEDYMDNSITYTKWITGYESIPVFDSTKSYDVNDLVWYPTREASRLYRCKASRSAGAFSENDFLETTLYKEYLRLTGEISETVHINITKDGTAFSGETVTVIFYDGTASLTLTTDTDGNCTTFTVAAGKEYTVAPASVTGYNDVGTKKFVSALTDRYVRFNFSPVETGREDVFITAFSWGTDNSLQSPSLVSAIEGRTVTLLYDGTTQGTTTVHNLTCEFSGSSGVPYGKEYTIVMPSVTDGGWSITEASKSKTACRTSCDMSFDYYEISEGILYAIESDGRTKYEYSEALRKLGQDSGATFAETIEYIGLQTSYDSSYSTYGFSLPSYGTYLTTDHIGGMVASTRNASTGTEVFSSTPKDCSFMWKLRMAATTADPSNHYFTGTYKGKWQPSTGVLPAATAVNQYWIASDSGVVDGTIYELGDWIKCTTYSSSSKLFTQYDKTARRDYNRASHQWMTTAQRVSIMPNIASGKQKTDMDGEGRTSQMGATGISPAADWASTMSIDVLDASGSTVTKTGFILSSGQWHQLMRMKTNLQTLVNAVMGRATGTTYEIFSGDWWTSAQGSDAGAWTIDNGGFYNYTKTRSYYAWVAFALN